MSNKKQIITLHSTEVEDFNGILYTKHHLSYNTQHWFAIVDTSQPYAICLKNIISEDITQEQFDAFTELTSKILAKIYRTVQTVVITSNVHYDVNVIEEDNTGLGILAHNLREVFDKDYELILPTVEANAVKTIIITHGDRNGATEYISVSLGEDETVSFTINYPYSTMPILSNVTLADSVISTRYYQFIAALVATAFIQIPLDTITIPKTQAGWVEDPDYEQDRNLLNIAEDSSYYFMDIQAAKQLLQQRFKIEDQRQVKPSPYANHPNNNFPPVHNGYQQPLIHRLNYIGTSAELLQLANELKLKLIEVSGNEYRFTIDQKGSRQPMMPGMQQQPNLTIMLSQMANI